jgi:hypothetical protein
MDDKEKDKKRMQRALDDLEREMQKQAELEETKTRLKEAMDKVRHTSMKNIIYSPAWITYGPEKVPIISRGTLTLIQGKAGAHKSRLAESLCSLLLSNGRKDILGFSRYKLAAGYSVCYVDTERNTLEDFPAAIQRIRAGAGYGPQDDTPDFYPASIKMEDRGSRLDAVKAIIEIVQDNQADRGAKLQDLLIVLDVISDCVRSFNNDSDSNEFYDYLNRLCETYGTAFLLVLHENPGTEKARGHLGTEGLNKVNTQLQIGYEKSEGGEDSDIIKLKFLKTRNAKRPDTQYLQFRDHGLIEADPGKVKEVLAAKAKAGALEMAAEALERFFIGKTTVNHQELINELMKELEVSERTARYRVQDLIKTGYRIMNEAGKPCCLTATATRGRATVYELIPATDATGEAGGDYTSDDIPF